MPFETISCDCYPTAISSISNIKVEPPGIPGCPNLPYPMSEERYTSHLSPTCICCIAITHPSITSERRIANGTPPILLSNVFPSIVRPV